MGRPIARIFETPLRLLPWTSPEGKPCYLSADSGNSRVFGSTVIGFGKLNEAGARPGRNHMSRLSFYLAYPPRARNARGPRRRCHGFAEVTDPASGGAAIPGCP